MIVELELETARDWWNNLPNDSLRYDLIDKYEIKILSRTEILEIWKKETQEYNETFNLEAHSSLIIDFDAVETIEEVAHKHDKYMLGQVQDSGFAYNVYNFITGAKSNAARNYWFKIFNEEQKGQFKQEKS
jgi:hypothetical protein